MTQVLGFCVLVFGTSMYNELLRGCLPGVQSRTASEDAEAALQASPTSWHPVHYVCLWGMHMHITLLKSYCAHNHSAVGHCVAIPLTDCSQIVLSLVNTHLHVCLLVCCCKELCSCINGAQLV